MSAMPCHGAALARRADKYRADSAALMLPWLQAPMLIKKRYRTEDFADASAS
jgi:hypothetical protein